MNSTALRYTFPEWTSTICAESPGDFNVVNNGLRYGLVWAIQPRHYNDSMDERLTRPLSSYVRELIRIRSRHKDLLFHGASSIRAAPKSRLAERALLRFRGMGNPGKAVVVVNFGDEEAAAEVRWPAEPAATSRSSCRSIRMPRAGSRLGSGWRPGPRCHRARALGVRPKPAA